MKTLMFVYEFSGGKKRQRQTRLLINIVSGKAYKKYVEPFPPYWICFEFLFPIHTFIYARLLSSNK